MKRLVCPGCATELPPDQAERADRAECPFCGAALPAPAEEMPDQTEGASPAAQPPKGSKIRVVEHSPDRLIMHISGDGAAATGLGCFALVWNLFMVVFTAVFASVGFAGGGKGPGWVVAPFLGLFWCVGLAMLYFFLKLKYERTLLLVERESMAIKKIFFSRQRVEQTALNARSRACLREAYSQNDEPVYRVEVAGAERTIKFGTGLDQKEKDWLVDVINGFWGVANDDANANEAETAHAEVARESRAFPESCSKCGAPLTGAPIEGTLHCEHCGAVHRGTAQVAATPPAEPAARPLRPDELPAGSDVRIEEATSELLRFSLPGAPRGLGWIVGPFALLFSAGWYAVLLFAMWGDVSGALGLPNLVTWLFKLPFLLAGLMPLGIGLYALWGRTIVSIGRETLTVRWAVGPLGYQRSVRIEQIAAVELASFAERRKNPRVRVRAGTRTDNERCCVVRTSAGKRLPVTLFGDEAMHQQVAGLVRARLAELGRDGRPK